MSKVTEFLEKLELSELETKLYLALLESPPVTVRELARKTGIGRTTSYPYIDLLLEKGLIMKTVKGSHTFVSANPPEESLKNIIEQKSKKVETIKQEFPEVIKTLNVSLPNESNIVEDTIKYYKGRAGVRKVYAEALQSSELRLYANLSEIVEFLLPEENEKDLFNVALEKNPNLKIFEIVADQPYTVEDFKLHETSKNKRYLFKFMPPHIDLNATCILLYDNKVAIINVREKSSSIVLHNSDYYVNSKKLFDFIWSVLPTV